MALRARMWRAAPNIKSNVPSERTKCRIFPFGQFHIADLTAVVVLLAVVGAEGAPTMGGAPGLIQAITNSQDRLELVVNKSRVLELAQPASRVSIVNPEIADVQIVSPKQVVVTGTSIGETTLMVWNEDESRHSVMDVAVTFNLPALQAQLDRLFPNDSISCKSIEGAIALEGRVSDIENLEHAVHLAETYTPKVLNMLQVPGLHQVLVEVRIAELSREFRREFGVNGIFNDGNNFIGGNRTGGLITPNLNEITVSDAVNLFFGFPNSNVDIFVQALQRKGLLRILAEPNLVAVSGEPASFLVGGEFPVPVVQGGGGIANNTSITISWREFGVRLNFTPTVYGDGKIRLHLRPEVSDLDFANGISSQGFLIPTLVERRAETTVELQDGQSFAIAGLISSKSEATMRKVPGLGNVPILGTLMRSKEFQEEETELVMIVTPHLVAAMQPAQVADIELPGEHYEPPSNKDFYLNGELETQTYNDEEKAQKSKWPERHGRRP